MTAWFKCSFMRRVWIFARAGQGKQVQGWGARTAEEIGHIIAVGVEVELEVELGELHLEVGKLAAA